MNEPGEAEGVIKYRLDHPIAPPLTPPGFGKRNAWQSVLRHLGLIGRDASRYGGAGYGNVILRFASGFLATGTQTGHLPRLRGEHYLRVLEALPEQNRLRDE